MLLNIFEILVCIRHISMLKNDINLWLTYMYEIACFWKSLKLMQNSDFKKHSWIILPKFWHQQSLYNVDGPEWKKMVWWADLDAEGSEILYTRNRERPLLQHVLGYIMVFPHQGIVQGCISGKKIGRILVLYTFPITWSNPWKKNCCCCFIWSWLPVINWINYHTYM